MPLTRELLLWKCMSFKNKRPLFPCLLVGGFVALCSFGPPHRKYVIIIIINVFLHTILMSRAKQQWASLRLHFNYSVQVWRFEITQPEWANYQFNCSQLTRLVIKLTIFGPQLPLRAGKWQSRDRWRGQATQSVQRWMDGWIRKQRNQGFV